MFCAAASGMRKGNGTHMFEAATATPSSLRELADAAPPPRRSRVKRLTTVNRSTRLGKRIDELKALFGSAFSPAELTPMRRERISAAAELQALAEAERGSWMRGEGRCNVDELVRLDRRAASAVKALGIVDAKPRAAPTLSDYLASKAASRP